jgi:hypothetical protein
MHLRRESLLVLALATTVCLLVGMIAGIQGNKVIMPGPLEGTFTAARTTVTVAPFVQPTSSGRQMAVLIVGVTDASAPQPKFEGCWIVAFTPGINQYYVLSFPPGARFQLPSLGSNQTLTDIYNQDVQQEVGYRFMRDAIQSVFPGMTIQAEVTLDRGAMADLASKVGGVPIGGQVLRGNSLSVAYDAQSFNGAAARMEFQRQAFQALFQALADQHWSPSSVADYLEQVPHAVSGEDRAFLTQLATSAPPLQNSELTWTVVGGEHQAAAAP